jgi:hypothetical protein
MAIAKCQLTRPIYNEKERLGIAASSLTNPGQLFIRVHNAFLRRDERPQGQIVRLRESNH